MQANFADFEDEIAHQLVAGNVFNSASEIAWIFVNCVTDHMTSNLSALVMPKHSNFNLK